MRTVLRADVSDSSLKAVLVGMAEHAGPEGEHCYPSVARLVAYTNLSEATIRSRLAKARELGLLSIISKAKQHKPTEYRMNLAALENMVHPNILELESTEEDATYGGSQTSSPRRSGKRQTSSRHSPDLQQPESRPPAAGPKPSVNPQEPTEETDARENKNAVRKRMELHFRSRTSLQPPKRKSEAGELWWSPLREIAELAGWDAANATAVIDECLNRARNTFQVSSPKSILKTARAVVAERAAGNGAGYSAAADVAAFKKERGLK
jgi:hypothetical protein